ncbi:MAG: ATP-binding cassette domain-containing protein [Xanthomonadaceae bacterium]|nr:ATP-binding cassette domain-containing protein [Xanthomonadaceae bacterium]
MLNIEDIHVYYGDSYVLQGVSLSVGKGEIVALLGRNGAGKTTTMRSIAGYNPPARGTILFQGNTISGRPVYANIRAGIGYVPEERQIFPNLTVEENLEVATRPPKTNQTPWDFERLFSTFPLLTRLRHHLGGELSGGEQQMLAIARSLAGNPQLLLLDEPCEGLAPVIVESLGNIIMELKKEIPILMAEQNAHFALGIADRAYVIDKGIIRHQGNSCEISSNEEVKDRYLAV